MHTHWCKLLKLPACMCGVTEMFQIHLHRKTSLYLACRVAQCIDKEILRRKICNIDIGIDIDKENFKKLITY